MTFSEIYEKIDAEIDIIKKYVSSGDWDGTSSFFDAPKVGELKATICTLGEIISGENSQSGIYLFVCNDDTEVSSRKSFNDGDLFAPLRAFDSDAVPIKEGDILYVGECHCFSNRLSAHLIANVDSGAKGLHLYASNRKNIKPENFKLILLPLKNTFYPNGCSKDDKQTLRELVELKLKAIYVPLVGK